MSGIFIVLGLVALTGDVEMRHKLIVYLLAPSFIVAFLIGFSRPSWLKPKWEAQLERVLSLA